MFKNNYIAITPEVTTEVTQVPVKTRYSNTGYKIATSMNSLFVEGITLLGNWLTPNINNITNPMLVNNKEGNNQNGKSETKLIKKITWNVKGGEKQCTKRTFIETAANAKIIYTLNLQDKKITQEVKFNDKNTTTLTIDFNQTNPSVKFDFTNNNPSNNIKAKHTTQVLEKDLNASLLNIVDEINKTDFQLKDGKKELDKDILNKVENKTDKGKNWRKITKSIFKQAAKASSIQNPLTLNTSNFNKTNSNDKKITKWHYKDNALTKTIKRKNGQSDSYKLEIEDAKIDFYHNNTLCNEKPSNKLTDMERKIKNELEVTIRLKKPYPSQQL